MRGVRAFHQDDIPQVAELHCRVFQTARKLSGSTRGPYHQYFRRVFLNNPWFDQSMPSLVYEEADGRIIGFLGVVPRPMWMHRRPVQAAISSQFVVDPASRSSLAGVELLRAFLAGPQDLSIADEANHNSERLWRRVGGSAALLYSLSWTLPLRPAAFAAVRFSQRRWLRATRLLLVPACSLADVISSRLLWRRFRPSKPQYGGKMADVTTLLRCAAAAWGPELLQPEYDEHSLKWLLAAADGIRAIRRRCIAVGQPGEEPIGWYLYHLNPNRVAEVLQIGAREHAEHDVLDHLIYDAWRQGAVALSGRMEPRFMAELWKKQRLSHQHRHWMLVHSRDPKLLEAICRGEAFLTRLEGEWCIRYRASQ